MKVIHFYRKTRQNGNFSIEGFYENIRLALLPKIEIERVICKFESNGIFKRLYNAVSVIFKQGDVNHITGDVNYLSIFLRKNRTITTILDCGILENSKGVLKAIYKIFWFTLPVKRSRFIVAISESTKRELLKYVNCDPEKIKVIHVAISLRIKKNNKIFDKENPVILHVGTAHNKNLMRLIEAIKGIKCRLEIIGKLNADYVQALERNSIDYLNCYNLTEEQYIKKLEESDILAYVSTYEGFGMPIVEANAIGRPVITSNLYSMPEVARDAACYANPYNINEIMKGILRIINDEDFRIMLIKNGYENAKKYNIKEISEKYYTIYNNILGLE